VGKRKLTRKDFLRAAGASLLSSSAFAASCARTDLSPTPPAKPAPPHNPPEGSVTNVILIILDSLRRDHLGAYGNVQMKTPTLDTLAEEGLRFTRPYPDAMPTIPARRAIHTGMRTLPFKAHWAPIPQEQTTLAEILKKRRATTPRLLPTPTTSSS
jgi:hypothetical protein